MYAEMTTQRAVGYVFIAVVVIGGIFFLISQMAKGRKEAGSEIELAANRGPGPDRRRSSKALASTSRCGRRSGCC